MSTAAQTWLSGQFGKAYRQRTSTGCFFLGNRRHDAHRHTTAPALPALKLSNSPLDSQLRSHIDSLPRRVNDQFQNQGDMVNFVIVGELKECRRH